MRVSILGIFGFARLSAQTDWPAYGHDAGGMRYSPLAQITAANVKNLRRAWTFDRGEPGTPVREHAGGRRWRHVSLHSVGPDCRARTGGRQPDLELRSQSPHAPRASRRFLLAGRSAGGSTKGALTCGFFAGMSVPLPPIDEQQEIASIVEGKVQEFQVSLISLLEVLHELRAEKSRIDKAIAQIESKTGRQQRSKRGRKGMGTEERKVVSTRMKHYWEQRRRAQA